MTKRTFAYMALVALGALVPVSTSHAQLITVYQPVVAAAPAPTCCQPAVAVAPVTTMYTPVVANYAPATPVVANYAPAVTTAYYAPAPVATTVLSPVAPVAYYGGEVWEYNPRRILPRRRWRRVYP